MARIIAVTNLKGGIGKTTTVVHVGAGLALKGARVLLIDVDAQGNLAPALGVQPQRTIYDVLVDQADPLHCISPARTNLDLIAADDSLLSAQPLISQRPNWSRVLADILPPLKARYDFILVDAPGSLTVLTVNALTASTDLLVPTTVEHFSIKGLELLFKQVARLKRSTSSIRVIVPTMFDGRLRQSSEVLERLQNTYGTLLAPPIRINVRLSEASAQGRTIYEYDPLSRGSLDYARLVDRLGDLWGFQTAPRARRPRLSTSPPANHTPPNGRHHAHHAAAAPANHNANASSEAPADTQPQPEHAASSAQERQQESLSDALSSSSAQAPLVAVPAPEPEPPAEPPAAQPMVVGKGSAAQSSCPHCGHPLRRTSVAGYRVAYCDHCKYQQQELVNRR